MNYLYCMTARVYKSTGSWYLVKVPGGEFLQARIKGKFKIDEITSTNPVAVGDFVEIETSQEAEKAYTIMEIHDRKNYVNRRSPSNKHLHHIIASNLDQSLLVATLREPRTSQGFVDRFLVACEAYHVPAVVILNKADVYREKEKAKGEEWRDMYEAIGYRVLVTSSQTGEGIEDLKELLKGKTTLMSGHSGVGKSTLINALMPELDLRTREVSGWSGKGMHTTTFAEMFDLPFGGQIIDTPGMREFGLVDISRQELSHYFPEMRKLLHACQFNNCLHVDEPGCAIKAAVESGDISLERYLSYGAILESIEEESW
ncbi:MAG: ribosome small subunit-dependent GTPase A [Chitinophagaceae bacterium]|jgi:ribosome biogenesis GTPase|nr:ribosome small subunit-dependent GTPase A [Chitinophagaceae bacterium]